MDNNTLTFTDNFVIPFTIYDAKIKGRVARLSDQLDIILKQHDYPDEIASILGQLLIVSSILGSQFKDEVTLSIQLQTEGRVQYIIVDYQMPGNIRGYAQVNPKLDFTKEAFLSVTADYKGQRYQGIIEVNDMQIDKAIEKYFDQSEQIQTSIKLAISKRSGIWLGSGILIQELPSKEDEFIWEEANILLNTIKDSELLNFNLPLEQLLYSVYHEAKPKVYDYIHINHKCRCSKERSQMIVKSLGLKEAKSLIIDGNLSVNCQFCNVSQNFTANDVEELYK